MHTLPDPYLGRRATAWFKMLEWTLLNLANVVRTVFLQQMQHGHMGEDRTFNLK